jgi:hypothetical protein
MGSVGIGMANSELELSDDTGSVGLFIPYRNDDVEDVDRGEAHGIFPHLRQSVFAGCRASAVPGLIENIKLSLARAF